MRIKNGAETYKISLPLGDLMRTNADDIAWFRLRCRLTDGNGNSQLESVISLSEIIRDIFELRVAASDNIFSGMNYQARIRAFQPFTNEPVKNVKIKGELELKHNAENKNKELKISARGESDAEGFALLDFEIPPNAELDYDGDLKIIGEKYGIWREVEEDLNAMTTDSAVYLNADKPLYQPGQTLNARHFAQGNVSANTVVADAELNLLSRTKKTRFFTGRRRRLPASASRRCRGKFPKTRSSELTVSKSRRMTARPLGKNLKFRVTICRTSPSASNPTGISICLRTFSPTSKFAPIIFSANP
jgi:hypothetical protein